MTEINVPACPTHGVLPRALHSESFQGIVEVIEELIGTVSGVGTTSYSRCPYGYPWNFEGVVRALEDLNTSISGISGGGGGGTASGIVAGSGIYITQSGSFEVINAVPSTSSGIVAGSGIYISQSGSFEVINATITSASGLTISAGSGIYLSDAGTKINLDALGTGSVTVLYSGTTALISGTDTQGGGGGGSASGTAVIVSGDPGTGYTAGSLWFDTNEGRLFVYASGNGVSDPAWYQTNAEAIASKGEAPPSGTGLNAPPRDGSIWFNSLMGSLFVYDAVTSGWYETGPSRSFAYGPAAPPPSTQGAGWYDSANSHLRVWDGSSWIQV
jgi:hypothetical protein